MWEQGNSSKAAKMSAEQARDILCDPNTGILKQNWKEQLTVLVPKIKAFFAKNQVEIKKMKSLIERSEDPMNNTEMLCEGD